MSVDFPMSKELPKVQSRDGLLRISDLARETGVSTATIKYYLREGLLPPAALKTGRNMAYYDPSSITRIRLIKELQSKRFLPLDVIKDLLKRSDRGISQNEVGRLLDLEERFQHTEFVTQPHQPVAFSEAALHYGVSAEDLRFAIELGVLSPVTRDGVEYFEDDDIPLLENLRKRSQTGITNQLIPLRTSLPIYVDAIEDLAQEELKLFSQTVIGNGPVDEQRVAEMAEDGMRLIEEFLLLLRRKVLRNIVHDLGIQVTDTDTADQDRKKTGS